MRCAALLLSMALTGCPERSSPAHDAGAPGWTPGPNATAVRGVLRSNTTAMGLLCRPPLCRVAYEDHGFEMNVDLQPWRDAGGGLHAGRWHAGVYFADPKEIDALEKTYPKPGDLVEVVVDEPRTRGSVPHEMFDRLAIRRVEDPELLKTPPLKPARIEDAFFGTLSWKISAHKYTGKRGSLAVSIPDGEDASPDLARARQQVEQVEQHLDDIRRDVRGRVPAGTPLDDAWVGCSAGSDDPALELGDVKVHLKAGRVETVTAPPP